MTSKKNLGNTCDFYVLAQLAQSSFIAGKTDDETLKTVNIQAETILTNKNLPSWIISNKKEQVYDGFLYVLVQVKSENLLPNFYILNSAEIGNRISKEHAQWLEKQKKLVKKKIDSNMPQFIRSKEELIENSNNWERIFKEAV